MDNLIQDKGKKVEIEENKNTQDEVDSVEEPLIKDSRGDLGVKGTAISELISLGHSIFPLFQALAKRRYSTTISIFNQSPLSFHRIKGFLLEGFLIDMPPEILPNTEEKVLLGATRLTLNGIRGLISFKIRETELRIVLGFSNPLRGTNKIGLALICDEMSVNKCLYTELKAAWRNLGKGTGTSFDIDYAQASELKSCEIEVSRGVSGRKKVEYLSISACVGEGRNENVKVYIRARTGSSYELLHELQEKGSALLKVTEKEKHFAYI